MGLGNKITNKVTVEITQNQVIVIRGVSCFYARYEDSLGDKTEFLNPNENLALETEEIREMDLTSFSDYKSKKT